MSSLWQANDVATPLLMHKLYSHIAQGYDLCWALQQSQQWLRGVPDSEGHALETRSDVKIYLETSSMLQSVDEEDRDDIVALWDRELESLPDCRPFSSPRIWATYSFLGLPKARQPLAQ